MIEQRIKEIRDKMKDRNIKMVAELSGVSYQTLWRFKHGKDIAFDALVKIDRYIDESERL